MLAPRERVRRRGPAQLPAAPRPARRRHGRRVLDQRPRRISTRPGRPLRNRVAREHVETAVARVGVELAGPGSSTSAAERVWFARERRQVRGLLPVVEPPARPAARRSRPAPGLEHVGVIVAGRGSSRTRARTPRPAQPSPRRLPARRAVPDGRTPNAPAPRARAPARAGSSALALPDRAPVRTSGARPRARPRRSLDDARMQLGGQAPGRRTSPARSIPPAAPADRGTPTSGPYAWWLISIAFAACARILARAPRSRAIHVERQHGERRALAEPAMPSARLREAQVDLRGGRVGPARR